MPDDRTVTLSEEDHELAKGICQGVLGILEDQSLEIVSNVLVNCVAVNAIASTETELLARQWVDDFAAMVKDTIKANINRARTQANA